MLQIFVLTIALASIVLLSLQPNKDGRQDHLTRNLAFQLLYVTDEVDMLKMGGTNSTLIESGVCQILPADQFYEITSFVGLVNYSIFANSVRNYVVFGNVSTFPITSYLLPPNTECPFYTDYTQMVNFYIGGCTTDLTGINITINIFN